MANPFFVPPPDLTSALDRFMAGYDRAQKGVKEQELKQSRQSALRRLQAGDLQGAFAESIGSGDVEGAKAQATFANNLWDQRFRQETAARQDKQWQMGHNLQRDRLALDRAQLDGGRIPAGYRRAADGNLEAIPGGPATAKPEDPFDNEQKLRKELEGNVKPYLETRRGYERLLSSKDTAAGDISLIFGFMKMLDPGSVVREGEFATAQNAAGVPDQIRNLYNRAKSGERLNPDQRAMFKSQAGDLYNRARGEYDTRVGQTRSIAEQYKLNPDRIVTPLDAVRGQPLGAGPGNLPAPPAGYQLVQ